VDLSKSFPLAEQQEVKIVLSYGITRAFVIPLVATFAAAVVSWGMEWKQIKEEGVVASQIEMA
jgi:hypothetical protein